MQLTKNFSLEEFAVSDSRPDLTVDIAFEPTEKYRAWLLAKIFLQPIREAYGRTIILSGKRTVALNRAIKGSANSDHLYNNGLDRPDLDTKAAVDFTIPGVNLEDVYRFIKLKYAQESYGQLIYYKKRRFIHLSLPTEKNQGESWIHEA